MKTQAYEFEQATVWQRIFLQSKVNGAPYKEQQFGFKWRWPRNTYLQRRLEYLRTCRSPDELWEPRQVSQKGMAEADVVGWGSVLGSGASLGTDGTPENPTYIDMASDDWTWCANPIALQRDCHSQGDKQMGPESRARDAYAWKILLVEDDPISLRNIAEFLRGEGYEVVEARDGEEALELFLKQSNLDLILTDIRMPRTDGIRLLEQARVISPNIPVILMTAFVARDVRLDPISLDADDFISKPFKLDRLLQKIHRTFEMRALT